MQHTSYVNSLRAPLGSALLAGLACTIGLAGGVRAADRYWSNGSGDGLWATTGNWAPSAGGAGPSSAPVAADAVFFNADSLAGTATTVVLGGNRAAAGFTFNNTGTSTIRANASGTTTRTLTIGSGGITINSGAGVVTFGGGTVGSVNLTLAASQSIANNGGANLTINNNVAGSGSPTLTNNGTGTNYIGMGALQSSVGKVVQDSTTSVLGLRNNNANFAGDLEILKGQVSIGNFDGNLGSGTAGKVVLGGSGTDFATIEINDNSNRTYTPRPIVLGTTSGPLKIVLRDEAGGSYTHTITGAISGPNNLTLESRASGDAKDDKLVFTTGGFNNAGTISHIGDSAGDLTISSVIGPLVTGVIQNSVTSRLVLSGANTYAGNTTVSAGTLVIASTAALPGFDTSGRYSVASGATLAVVNAVTDAEVAAILAAGNIAAGGSIGFDTTAADREYAASITDTSAGALGLVKQGANTLVLSGSNSYTGPTRVEVGTLSIATAAALPGFGTAGRYTVSSGAVLAVANAVTDPEVAAILGTGNIASGGSIGFDTTAGNRTYAGAITDPPAGGLGLVKLGGNALTLAGVNSYTGNTQVAAGTLVITSSAALPGWDTPGRYTVAPGAALAVPNSVSDADVATILGTGNIAAGGAIGFDTSAGDRTYSGTIADPPAGGLGLFKLGGNTLTLGAANTFTGPTRSVFGTLAVANAAALGGSTLDMNAADSGTVTFGQDATLGGLTGSRDLDLGGRSVSIGNNNQSTAYSGVLSNGSLAKIGPGLLTLSGANTYAGGTTISAGTLAIASTAALPGFDTAGRYSVASGAVLSVANAVTDADVSAILATGNIAAGGVIGFDTTDGDRTTPALAGDIGLLKTGANTLSLAESGNIYSGATTVAAGTLRIPGTQTIASDVRAEAGAQLHLDGDVTMTGPVRWQGGDGLLAVSGTSEISGPMSLGNSTGNILNVAEGAQLTISGNVAAEGTNSRFFVAGSGELIVTGNIGQLNTSNAGGMQGPATVHLLGLNSFTGQFNIGQGTVVVNTLYNTTFESSLGVGTGTNGIITNMAGGNTGEATLRYIGEETATNRQVRFQSNVAGARSVIEASGTGPLTFLNSAFNAPDTTSSRAPQTLVLSGTNAGVIEGRIANNSTTSVISLVKEGTGTWTLKDPTTFTGTTTVTAGTLVAAAPTALETSPLVTVAAGATWDVSLIADGYSLRPLQTLAGSGTVAGSLVLGTGSTVSPGASPGPLTISQDVTLSAGGNYNWQILDATGTAGATTGWDLLSVGGALSISATSADPFKLNLWSLSSSGPDVNGDALNFSPTQSYTWTIASAAGGITGFSSDAFAINTAATNGTGGFTNSLAGGSFSLAVAGNDLNLVFTPGSGPSAIVIDVPSGTQTQAQAGYPAIASATSVTKTGAGTVVFDAANAYTGPTTISAGTLQVANADGLTATTVTVGPGATLAVASGTTMKSPAVIVDGGTLSATTLAVDGASGIASLAINAGTVAGAPAVSVGAGGQLSLVQDARVTMAVGGLTVTETSGGGRLDLGAGQVSVAAGGIAAADLRADIIAGRNGGAWNGASGIMSSTAAVSGGTRDVGYVVAGDGSARVSFAAPGDTNLDGQVDLVDLLAILASGTYSAPVASVWDQGDFNYDGFTDLLDLLAILGSGTYDQGNYFPAAPITPTGSVAAVPEPGTLAWAGAALAIAGWLGRRRGGPRS